MQCKLGLFYVAAVFSVLPSMGRKSSRCYICGGAIQDKTKYLKLMSASWFGICETIADFHQACFEREFLQMLLNNNGES